MTALTAKVVALGPSAIVLIPVSNVAAAWFAARLLRGVAPLSFDKRQK